MKKNYLIAFCALTALFSEYSYAVHTLGDGVAKAYSYYGGEAGSSVPGAAPLGEWILAGGGGKYTRGTWDDEYAMVAFIATESLGVHGGYFCPMQIQCANKRKDRDSWSVYPRPKGFSADKCVWLCKSGYGGTNCATAALQEKDYDPLSGALDLKTKMSAGVSMNTSDRTNYEHTVNALYSWQFGGGHEYDVLLGITRFVKYGAFVAPIAIGCGMEGYRDNVSFISIVSVRAKNEHQTLLCMNGYIPNSTNTDCVRATEANLKMATAPVCAGVNSSKFDANLHEWRLIDNCKTFVCRDPSKAFEKEGSYECVACGDGTNRYGPNIKGVCLQCFADKYYSKNALDCRDALVLTKEELQYGKGRTRNSNQDNSIQDQCWYHVTPNTYRGCVVGCPEGYKWDDGECVSTTDAAPDGSALGATGAAK